MLALSLLNLYGGKCPKCENVDQDACMKAVQFAHIHIPLSVYDLPPEIDWNANLAVMQRCLRESKAISITVTFGIPAIGKYSPSFRAMLIT
jgi:hypothetical protein